MIDKTLSFRQTKKVRHYFWKHFVRKTAVSTQNNAPSTQKKRPWLKIVLTAVLFLITGMLTQFMSNTAAAALLCPIGLSIAESLGASPTAVVLAIGFSASAAYMTPVATPPNTMIYGPGGLQFMDYVKVGTPLFIIVMIMALVLMPIIWPFFPNA